MSVAARVESGVGSARVQQPYLSVVATTRNDDHGGGMLERMQVFVDALVAQCVRHRLGVELILVEWNPPDDRPRLIDAVRWPEGMGYVTVRIIEVPPALHASFDHSERLPVFQMIAKNVGVRRARAPFVLATNVDLLFSDGVMRALASRALRRRRVYRVDRYDVEAGVPAGGTVSEQLRWCGEHVLRINSRRGTADLTTGAFYPIYSGYLDLPAYVWRRIRLRQSGLGTKALAPRRGRREVRPDRRILRDRQLHRHPGQALLVRDVRPAGVLGRRASRP